MYGSIQEPYTQNLYLGNPWAGLLFGGIKGSLSMEENISDLCLCFSPILFPLNHNLFSSNAFAQRVIETAGE